MKARKTSSGFSLSNKTLFGGLAMAALVCLFLAQIRARTSPLPKGIETDTLRALSPEESIRREKLFGLKLDLHYMNRRRVPNGADPIHNRRTGNSGRPPGKA